MVLEKGSVLFPTKAPLITEWHMGRRTSDSSSGLGILKMEMEGAFRSGSMHHVGQHQENNNYFATRMNLQPNLEIIGNLHENIDRAQLATAAELATSAIVGDNGDKKVEEGGGIPAGHVDSNQFHIDGGNANGNHVGEGKPENGSTGGEMAVDASVSGTPLKLTLKIPEPEKTPRPRKRTKKKSRSCGSTPRSRRGGTSSYLTSDYDIDNIVPTEVMFGTPKRLPRKERKEIHTPDWGPVGRQRWELDCQSDSEEDLSDLQFARRHYPLEIEEREFMLNLKKSYSCRKTQEIQAEEKKLCRVIELTGFQRKKSPQEGTPQENSPTDTPMTEPTTPRKAHPLHEVFMDENRLTKELLEESGYDFGERATAVRKHEEMKIVQGELINLKAELRQLAGKKKAARKAALVGQRGEKVAYNVRKKSGTKMAPSECSCISGKRYRVIPCQEVLKIILRSV